jgi:signal peptidase I
MHKVKKNRLIALSEGTSMLPMIHQDDELDIWPVDFDSLKINDMAVFKEKDKIITHRVIYKTNKYVITKGDNNPASDGKIYRKQIIGQVKKIKRQGKSFDLKQLYLVQSTSYFKEIIKISEAFENKSIRYVFLKGLPINLYYQGSSPQRIYFDCDLMIDKSDFFQVKKIFYRFGYNIISTSFDKKEYLSADKRLEVSFSKYINSVPVIFDVHFKPVFLMTQLTGLGALYKDKLTEKMGSEFLKNRIYKKISQSNFPILEKYDLIFYLVLHFFHHNYHGGFRLELLSQIIKKERLRTKDWTKIAKIINDYEAANFAYPGFILLRKYFKTKIPNNFFKLLNTSNHEVVKKYSQIDIFSDEARFSGGINRFVAIYRLSSNPFYKKIMVFFSPQVEYFIFLYLKMRLSSFLSAFGQVRQSH